jgi:sugar diacid utilization regulator
VPAAGGSVAHPPESIAPQRMHEIAQYAVAAVRGDAPDEPPPAAEVVPIRIGPEVVGVVAAAPALNGATPQPAAEDSRAWLEAAATAAAVTTLMREARAGNSDEARRALLRALSIGPPAEVTALVGQARRLGFDLSAGAVAICALAPDRAEPVEIERLGQCHAALLADLGGGRVLGLAPSGDQDERAAQLAAQLRGHGMRVALSSRRREPETLHDAVREAELLLELSDVAGAAVSGQEETYRLLIGVLLRNPEELASLRAGTISPLAAYDSEHDTDLLATLETFLAHDGSTTETAEAMNLHRHTVGYRLSRVHEVSQLSPYESEGRERLSLGLKAHQILQAAGRRAERL